MFKLRSIIICLTALVLTVFVTKVYWHAGFPYTHDGENHLARFANYKIALKEGQIPPRFAPNLVNHYGYPVFNYNYPLANMVSVPLSVAHVEYETIFKLLIVGAVWFGLYGMGRWLLRLNFSLSSALMGMVGFALAPYLLNSLLYRGNIGEIMALGLLPWLLSWVEDLRTRNPIKFGWSWLQRSLFAITIMTAFLLSHNVTVLFGVPLLFGYALLRLGKSRTAWMHFGGIFVITTLLSLWFWLPAVAEKSLVVVDDAALSSQFYRHFSTIGQLFIAPLHFGFSYPGSIDSLSFSLGFVQTTALLVSTLFLLKKGLHRKLVSKHLLPIIIASLVCVLLVFQLSITQPFWQLVPLARFIQFPWRLGLFISIIVAPLVAYAWQIMPRLGKGVLVLCIFGQAIAFAKAQPAGYFHRPQIEYDLFAQSTTTANENLPKTFTYLSTGDWQPSPQFLTGGGDVQVLRWTGTARAYELSVNEPSTIVEPTMNFAGWETQISPRGKLTPVVATYENNASIAGRLAYHLEPGEYSIITDFTQKTWPRMIGNSISGVTLLVLLYAAGRRILPRSVRFFIGWKLGLLIIAAVASSILLYIPSFPYADSILMRTHLPSWIYSWANFDGVHYLTIAEKGYKGTGLIQAFFPVFPEMVSIVTGSTALRILFGLGLTTVFSFLLLVSWKKLLKLDYDTPTSWLGVLALFLFPTAFFLQAFYTESLFLLLVVVSFYFARRGRWWLAGIAAAIASATRIVGIALVPALLVELWLQKPAIHHQLKKVAFICFGAMGLFGYMLYLWIAFGDPLYFLHVQAEFGSGRSESVILYPQVVWRYLKILATYRPIDLKYFTYIQEFVAGSLGALALCLAWFKVRKSYLVFSVLTFVVPTLTGTFTSMPRYLLACPALFILIALLLKGHRWVQIVYFTVSTLLLIMNTVLFIQGYWVA